MDTFTILSTVSECPLDRVVRTDATGNFRLFNLFSFLTMSDPNITTAKLLALLNASAIRPNKRPRQEEVESMKVVKLNRRSRVVTVVDPEEAITASEVVIEMDVAEITAEDISSSTGPSPADLHFANGSTLLDQATIAVLNSASGPQPIKWKTKEVSLTSGAKCLVSTLSDDQPGLASSQSCSPNVLPKLWAGFQQGRSKLEPS